MESSPCDKCRNVVFYIIKDTVIQEELLMPIMNEKCPGDMFQCNNSECILAIFVCDGHPHCSDGTDEGNFVCAGKCTI